MYHQFKYDRAPDAVPGFCAVAKIDNIREYNYALTPGRYISASDDGGEDEPFEERFPTLKELLTSEIDESARLGSAIKDVLATLG